MRLDQVISRHHPDFDVAAARLGLGADGHVYLASGAQFPVGQALRIAPDGGARRAGAVGYAVLAITANADGAIATAEAHFSKRVALWDRDFNPVGRLADFTDSDQDGWLAPSDVQPGASDDFYAIDQYRLRVVRVGPDALAVAAYPLDALGESATQGAVGLRVSEAAGRFYTAWPSGTLWASAMDGRPLWSVPARPAGDTFGAFDVSADGHLYVLTAGDAVRVFDGDGGAAGTLTLTGGASHGVTGLRARGTELFVKRADPAVLFEVYEAATGRLLRSIPADVERLTVSYPSPVWTAGRPNPLTIGHDGGAWRAEPRLRAWLRPLGVPEFTELGDTVPAAARGLYHVRVSPDGAGRLTEYVVDTVVEIRTPDTHGSVSIFTPLNRFSYGRGEPITATVLARAAAGQALPFTVTVRVLGPGGVPVTAEETPLRDGRGTLTLDATAGWDPGRYVLDAQVPGFTVAPQYLDLGPGLAARPAFHLVQHGDYIESFPSDPRRAGAHRPRFADLPDLTEDHLARAAKLGLNLFVDRLGHGWQGRFQDHPADQATVERLSGDPAAVAPEKAIFEDPTRRTIAGYGARGMREQAILLYMDAGLPLGAPYDTRTPEQMVADLQAVTRHLLDYPAFRGWSWAANWWYQRTGAEEATGPGERAAYDAALEDARETGTWAPVLDTVTDRTFALKADAERRFRAALDAVAPGKVSALTAPYRSVQSHPPALFRDADEVDLHYQAEQIQPPQVTPHQVDF
ncbi:hypothetical protein [Nonomuraea sp. NPDC050643]|uniref:hypothetical protein n=1 Tax=Nonomuraea sp. NPDC050643 TaxID=3155660 RepID=UPI0033EFE024